MKIIHMAGGGDIGGAKTHIISILKELSYQNTVKLISFRYGDFAKSAKDEGLDVDEIKFGTIFSDIAKLLRIYDKFQPDIVHCHGAKANLMGLILKKYRKACVTTTIHSDYRKDYLHNLFRQATIGTFNTFALRVMDYHIAVTEEFARVLIGRGFKPYNMFSIYNGIDFDKQITKTDKEQYFKRYGIPYDEKDVIVGLAARLTKVKDIPTLIKGFAEALKSAPNMRLLIAGDGEDKQALLRLSSQLNVQDRVHFLGWIDNIDEFFSAIDIDVISSLSETFPYTLTEGIRAGAIPVSSRVGGAESLIEHGVSGYIFEPRDYKALGTFLAQLANDKDKRIVMQKEIYKRTKERFSLSTMRKTQQDIYESILYRFNQKGRNKVIICGAYGKGNAGDEAIKHTTLAGMRAVDKNMEICVMTLKPRKERVKDRVETVFTFNIVKLYFHLKQSKLFVSGGGSLIQDITSSRSLFFYLYTLYLAKKLNCSVIMFGCGIGPIIRPTNRKLSTRIINKYVDVITVRDQMSLSELSSLDISRPRIKLTADPAINLKPDMHNVHKIYEAEALDRDKKYICLALREWKNFDKDIQIAKACDNIYHKYGYTAVFYPMEYPKDLVAAQRVSMHMQTAHHIIQNKYPTDLAAAFLADMQAVIAMRLHALIFAAASFVPVAGLSYDVKVSGFLEYIESDSCVELEDITKESIIQAVDSALENTQRSKAAIMRLKEQEKTNNNELSELLKNHKENK